MRKIAPYAYRTSRMLDDLESKKTMNKNSHEALSIALFAVLYEAKSLGYDVDAICKKATEGMFDGGKPYRGGSTNWVVPANEAIENALKDTKTCSK